jgi:peroxiredoxin
MTITPSKMIPLGTQAPDFILYDTISGKTLSLKDLRSEQATVVIFTCNHCPFVKHLRSELIRLAHDYMPDGISFIAINSNDPQQYSEDSPENMKRLAKDLKFPFPYLFDGTQEVAKAYGATCTPDFFVFDYNMKCVYRGQFDESRPTNDIPVTGKDLRAALDAVLENRPVPPNQNPSIGCDIKWKK